MTTKRCSGCKVEKVLEEFPKSNKNKDGRQYYCRECYSEKHKKYRKKIKESGPTIVRTSKHCNKCDTTKPISQFGKFAGRPDGHLDYCKPCWVTYVIAAQKRKFDRDNRI